LVSGINVSQTGTQEQITARLTDLRLTGRSYFPLPCRHFRDR
jgi:hypothetical protein